MRYINKITGEVFFGDLPHDMSNYEIIPDDNKPYGIRNGQVKCLENDEQYKQEQKVIQNKQYFQEYISKKIQYQSAIYDTEVGFLCGKLTEQEKTTQINLLIALINQAEEVYDQQIGEN